MAKYCRAIGPSCRAKEPPPPEASSCLDTDFTPDIRRFQQLVPFHDKVVLLHHKSHFVVQLNRFQTKNTGLSLINEAVVLNKQMAIVCRIIWTTNGFCLLERHLDYLNHYLHEYKRQRHWQKKNLKNCHSQFFLEIIFSGGFISKTYYSNAMSWSSWTDISVCSSQVFGQASAESFGWWDTPP